MWTSGTIQDLLNREPTKTGRVGSEPIRAVIEAARDNQASFESANPALSSISGAVTWTTAQTLRSSPGRLYHLRVVNTDEDDEVNVILYDSTTSFPVGGCVVPAQVAAVGNVAAVPGVAEDSFFAAPNGVGQKIRTSLLVRAVQSDDGTTAADSGSLTVTALTSA